MIWIWGGGQVESDTIGDGVWGGGIHPLLIEGGSPRKCFNFWVSNCIFWCILGAILSATLLSSTGRRAYSAAMFYGE